MIEARQRVKASGFIGIVHCGFREADHLIWARIIVCYDFMAGMKVKSLDPGRPDFEEITREEQEVFTDRALVGVVGECSL